MREINLSPSYGTGLGKNNIMIPIFICTHDRLKCLKGQLESFKQIKTPHEIILIDNQTTFPKTLDYLKQLESDGMRIIWRQQNDYDFTRVIDPIVKELDADYYCVTDPDVDFHEINGDVLEFYQYLHEKNEVDVVGPMLIINDIPDFYPLKGRAINGYEAKWWKLFPSKTWWKDVEYKWVMAHIDMTFGMYKRSFLPFHKANDGIRVYPPYAAKHSDWYIDINNMTDDQKWYVNHCRSNCHYSSNWLRPYLSKTR